MTPVAASDAGREGPRGHAFSRSQRLKRRRLIRILFDRDHPDVQSLSAGSVRAVYRFADSEEVGVPASIQVGIFVGRRVGGAVRRNRIRRQMREAYRRRQPDLFTGLTGRSDTLTLGLVFRADAEVGWQDLVRDVDSIVERLIATLT